jgi:hypothetical protein
MWLSIARGGDETAAPGFAAEPAPASIIALTASIARTAVKIPFLTLLPSPRGVNLVTTRIAADSEASCAVALLVNNSNIESISRPIRRSSRL